MSHGCTVSSINVLASSDSRQGMSRALGINIISLGLYWRAYSYTEELLEEYISWGHFSMNDFREGAEVVDLGREFQREDTLLENKFKDELILFTSEWILVIGHLLEFK